MKLDYQTLLPQNYSASSRVWIYQASRIFSIQEALELESQLEQFTQNWQSHGAPCTGYIPTAFWKIHYFNCGRKQRSSEWL